MFLNKNLTHMKIDGNASESLPLKFLYIEIFFTQISLKWMVFKMQKIVFISTVNIVVTDLYLTFCESLVQTSALSPSNAQQEC